MLINLTNHSSDRWGKRQLEQAEKYGEIRDLPFPLIRAACTSEEIDGLVVKYLAEIQNILNESDGTGRDAVMIQGEFVFTFRMVTALKKQGLTAIASITERKTDEEILSDGSVRKVSLFEFQGFRRY